MKFLAQTENETALQSGYNYRFDLSHLDITQGTISTAQTFTVWLPARAGDKIHHVALFLAEAFQDTTDTAQNTNTVSVGDSGDLDNMIVAIECNANGSLGTFPAEDTGDGLPYTVPASPLAIQVTVNATSGKKLDHLNKGRLFVLFQVFAQSNAQIIPGASNLQP